MAQTKPRNNCGSKILRSLVEERSNLLVLHCVRLLNRGGPEGQHWSQIRSLIASEILGEDWNQVLTKIPSSWEEGILKLATLLSSSTWGQLSAFKIFTGDRRVLSR